MLQLHLQAAHLGDVQVRGVDADDGPCVVEQRGHRHREHAAVVADRPDHILERDFFPLLDDLFDRHLEVGRTVGDFEVAQRPPEVSVGKRKALAGRGVRGDERAIRVDDDLRRAIGLERRVSQSTLSGHRLTGHLATSLGEQEETFTVAGLAYDREKAALQIHRREHVRVAEEHLRPSEQDMPGGVQREEESREDPFLRIGVEIHQRVAAQQEINA